MVRFHTYPIEELQVDGAAASLGLPREGIGGLVYGFQNQLRVRLGAVSAPVCVDFQDLPGHPGEPERKWEDVVELDVQLHSERALTTALMVVTGPGSGQQGTFAVLGAHGQGLHRLRVSALGLDRDAGVERDGEDQGPVVEHFLLELWPSQRKRDPAVMRVGSEVARARLARGEMTGSEADSEVNEPGWEEQQQEHDDAAALARPVGAVAPDGSPREGATWEVGFRNLHVMAGERAQVPPVGELYPGGLVYPDGFDDASEGDAGAVATGVAMGPVLVFSEALAGAPTDVEAEWEDVSEYSVYVSAGPLRVEGDGDETLEADEEGGTEAPRLDAHGPGWYRLRIHGANRALEFDGVARDPLERYLAQAWPEPAPRAMIVWREELDALRYPEEADPLRATDAAPRTVPTLAQWRPRRTEKWDNGFADPELEMTGEDWHRITTLYGKEAAKSMRAQYKAARGLTTEALAQVEQPGVE